MTCAVTWAVSNTVKSQTKDPTVESLQMIALSLEFCNCESYLVTSATKAQSQHCKVPQQRPNLESTVLAPKRKAQGCHNPKMLHVNLRCSKILVQNADSFRQKVLCVQYAHSLL